MTWLTILPWGYKPARSPDKSKNLSININHFHIQQFICSKYVEVEWLEASWNLLSKQKKIFVSSPTTPGVVSLGKREMSNSIQTDKSFVKLLALLMVIYSAQLCESHIAELLFEEEDLPAVAAANMNHFPPSHAALPPMAEDNSCHVEFTVLKRAVGHCIKLGKTTKACVSGTYIHPFHPDCMWAMCWLIQRWKS